jgi:hypothetical protein
MALGICPLMNMRSSIFRLSSGKTRFVESGMTMRLPYPLRISVSNVLRQWSVPLIWMLSVPISRRLANQFERVMTNAFSIPVTAIPP